MREREERLEGLKGNFCVKSVSIAVALGFHGASAFFLFIYAYGAHKLSDEPNCWAVEFPETSQFSEDPTASDPKNYGGLKSVNVTGRFNWIVYIGFYLELTLFTLAALSLVCCKSPGLGWFLGYLSFFWFVYLLFGRFDHYGKVCSGDLSSSDSFSNMHRAGEFFKMYVELLWAIAGCLIVVVLVFSCCFSPKRERKKSEHEE